MSARITGSQGGGGGAWRWRSQGEQYYLHLFAPEQADLNWENPAVRAGS